MMIRKKNKSTVAYLFVFVIATFFITVFSKCSPLYGFNNSPDATVIFEVGRRMFDGSVLYKKVRFYLQYMALLPLFLRLII